MDRQICVSLSFKTYDELINLNFSNDFDILEWRVDEFKDNNIKQVISYLRSKYANKLLITYRSESNDSNYYRKVKELLELDVDIIDLEYNSLSKKQLIELISLSKEKKTEIILSYHNYQNILNKDEFIKLLKDMNNYHVDYLKVIMTGEKKHLDQFELLTNSISSEIPITCFLMGKEVIETRISNYTKIIYTYIDRPTAPGQLSLQEAKKILQK